MNRPIFYPKLNDRVIGIITNKTGDGYSLDISIKFTSNLGSTRLGELGQLEFNGCSKRNRPHLEAGDVVFSRVNGLSKWLPYSLTCKSTTCKKDWTSGENPLSQLKDGIVFDVPLEVCSKLRKTKSIFESLKNYSSFEIVIGVNGR